MGSYVSLKVRSIQPHGLFSCSHACADGVSCGRKLNAMNKQALTDPGLPSDRMPEAEVALRLAAFLLSLPRSGSIASVAIDRASLTVRNLIVLDIGRFMTGAGWEQVKQPQVSRNTWTGTYLWCIATATYPGWALSDQ